MGAYLRKPITDKTSESGEYTYCGRKIIYASTAMQGWRISMEDAHSVVPHFDQDSSLFAVYDGHGGKEVAVYCAQKMGELIKATDAYKSGDFVQALKDAFVNCDKKLLLPEVAKELKRIANEDEEKDSVPENLDELMTEATMPLSRLMEHYGQNEESSDANKDGETGGSEEGGRVKTILQMLCNNAGIDVDFEDSDDSESDTEASLEPEDSDCTSDEDTSHLSSHDTSHDTSHDSNTPTDPAPTTTSSLTALLQSRPIKSVPEPSKTESVEGDLKPRPPTTAASKIIDDEKHDLPTPIHEKKNAVTSNSTSPQDSNANSSKPSVDDDPGPMNNAESAEITEGVVPEEGGRVEKPQGLKELLTAGVKDRYNPDGSPVGMEAAEEEIDKVEVSRKRPHPDNEDYLLSPQTFSKRRESSEEGHESGTTAVVCLLRGTQVLVANAGDSRCVMSSNGKAVELSFDHKPTDPLEFERIKKAGGRVGADGRVNRGLNLSRAIGDHFYKQEETLPLEEQMISPLPDVKTAVLDERSEFIVLACDGIWNCKSSQEVVDYIHQKLTEKEDGETTQQDLVAICEALCDDCLAVDTDNDGTGCDNMTCILVSLKPINKL